MSQQAIIYCRVSSPKQVTEGHGLESQETRCREYAKHKGYKVLDVFHEEGITGKLMDRPKMQEMLSFLKKNKKENHIV
ncbi:MAG: recombinase family protein, partial [Alphaproteobacteria bacterium]|nr:recombinase family protein [Alphaproteobacteria bacterium]